MSNFSHLSDHAAVSKAHDILKEAITSQGKNSPLLNHLRQNHPDVYNILLSDCKTHGPGLKAAIRNFAGDATKVAPPESIANARKALDIIETLPKEILAGKSNTGWWVAGIGRLQMQAESKRSEVAVVLVTNRAKKAFHNQEVGQLKKQHTEIQDKLDRLVDLRLEGEITKEEFETKKNRLKDRQYELDQLILTYDKADDQFTKTLCALLTIASDSDKIWLGSTISEKRELLNFVFANLQLKGATLCYELRKPFDKMLNQADCIKWRRGWDSNPRYVAVHTLSKRAP
jgi:hypothetical protein